MDSPGHGAVVKQPKGDSLALMAIFTAGFLLLLCVALAAQLFTLQWKSWLPGAENEKSMIGGVKAAVYTFMPLLT